MEVAELIGLGRRWWWLIAVCTLAGLGLAFLSISSSSAATVPPSQLVTSTGVGARATATLVQGDPAVADPSGLDLNSMAYFTTTGQVPTMVAHLLGYKGSPAALAAQVTATPNDEFGVLTITAIAPTSRAAVRLANAFSTQLIAYLDATILSNRTQQLSADRSTLQHLQSEITGLASSRPTSLTSAKLAADKSTYQSTYASYQQLAATPVPTTNLTVLQSAVSAGSGTVSTSTAATGPAPLGRKAKLERLVFGLFGGFVLGALVAFALERIDPRLYGRRRTERAFGLPVLAELPKIGNEVVVATAPASADAEAYRLLRTALVYRASDPEHDGHQMVLVTSPSSETETGGVVANLAASLSEAGISVLVVVANLAGGQAQERLGVAVGPGLADVLGRGPDALGEVVREASVEGVRVVPPGFARQAPGRLVGRTLPLLEQARVLAEVVLVEVAPVLEAHDATELAAAVDTVLIISHDGKTSTSAAASSAERLGRVGAPLYGVVLVGRESKPRLRSGRHRMANRPPGPSRSDAQPVGEQRAVPSR